MKKIEELIKRLRNEKCIIYGTGVAGKSAAESFSYFDILISGFVTGDNFFQENEFMGFPLLKENEIPKDALIIICADPEHQIHHRLESRGYRNYIYLEPQILRDRFWDPKYDLHVTDMLDANQDKICKVRNLLADEKSLLVFDTLLNHRKDYDFQGIQRVKEDYQYFNNSLIQQFSGSYVDCGAFTGDTLTRFMNQLKPGQDYTYYAFEADTENFRKLNQLCEKHGWENVHTYNNAVWSSNKYLGFETDTKQDRVSGKIVESDTKTNIQGARLDDVLSGKKIDMIGMDIEGAELEALKGAKEIIRSQAPILSISVYHDVAHFWEVPLQIKEYNAAYQIFFRHHRWTSDDTVCYAIPN